MRALQKLVRNGNTTHVAIIRPLLVHLGWLPGEAVVVEVQEDYSLRIYKPDLSQQVVKRSHPILETAAAEVTR